MSLARVTVVKRDTSGRETWRYAGRLVAETPAGLILEARFNRSDLPFMGTQLRRNDRFLETYFWERWYNVFEIHDRESDRIKGWYCNLAEPARREGPGRISYVDLALDLWVAPDGTQTVLDEQEFQALGLEARTEARVRQALQELQARFAQHGAPGLE